MNQDAETINRMRAITISREYGSGGGEIATRLSRHLGWRLLDHEIVERVALEMGTSSSKQRPMKSVPKASSLEHSTTFSSWNRHIWQVLHQMRFSLTKRPILGQ